MPWFAAGYPILAHLGVWLHDRRLQCLALIWLLATALYEALARRRIWAWCSLIVGACVLVTLTLGGGSLYALYVPPVVIPLAMLILFAGSLRGDATPLITRLAEAMRGEPLPPILKTYTRNVTVLWCIVSSTLLISAIVTAVWTRPEIWSFVTNFVHYIVIAAVFVFEFVYRHFKYGRLEQWGFVEYLRRLARTKLRG